MKVLHVIPSVAPRYGGPSQAVLEMTDALRAAGTDARIATTDADDAGRLPVELGREIDYRGVPTIFFARQFSEAYKYSRPLAQWLDSHAREFDVIHIHAVFSHACLAAGRAARERGVPYIVRPLGTLAPWSLGQKRWRKRLFWRLGVAKLLRGAAAIHYTAPDEKMLAENALGLQRGVVIPLGLNFEDAHANTVKPGLQVSAADFRASYPTLGDNPYLLVLARLHPKKGQDLLFEALAPLWREPDLAHWRLLLAGEGEPAYQSRLQEQITAQGLQEKVIFTGWLSGAQKNAALQNASLLALTSHQENFGLCVLESLACGVPVLLSSGVNLAPEVARVGVGWVTPLTVADLRRTLAVSLRATAQRQAMSPRARAFAQNYRWPQIVQQLVKLYLSIQTPSQN